MTSVCKVPSYLQVPDRTLARDWAARETCLALKGELATCFFQPSAVLCDHHLRLAVMAVLCGRHVDNLVSRCPADDSAERKKHALCRPDVNDTVRLFVGIGQTLRYHYFVFLLKISHMTKSRKSRDRRRGVT
jgi:hypothetical protein